MKTPRVTDFDLNAEVPALGSPLDGLPVIQRPTPPGEANAQATYTASAAAHAPTPAVDVSVPVARPVPPVPPEPVVPPVLPVPLVPPLQSRVAMRRPIKQRHPFDIYADQLESLRQLAVEDRKQGGLGSMSAMVREALDAFLAKRIRPAAPREAVADE